MGYKMIKNMWFTKYFKAFSLVEILVALIIVSIIMAAMAPIITKRLSSSGVTIAGGGGSSGTLSSSCEAFGANCTLCYQDKCVTCSVSCSSNQATDISTCSCKACSTLHGNNCLKCNTNECIECSSNYYIKNGKCEICPIGSYCNGTTATVCPNGKYTDATGQTSCKNCEAGYKCENGTKLACAAGTYSQTSASSCTTCPKGYYCVGASDKQQCTGSNYQSSTGQSSCQNCAAGYYVTDDRTSCNLCEIGYICTGNGTKSQCGAGSYTNTTGSQVCTVCPVGYTCSGGSNLSQCPAGSYSSSEGATSCTTCPAGYYCTGGSNLTSCASGYYSTATGASSSSTCSSCSSNTSNCSACNAATGVCSTCNTGYVLNSSNICEKENPCGDLALKVTISGSDYCITKYNIGDNGLTMPTGVNTVNAGTSPSQTTWCYKSYFNYSSWKYIYTANSGCSTSGYNACTRTVCGAYPLSLMENICSSFSYNNLSNWSLLTGAQWKALTTEQLKELNICAEIATAGFSTCSYIESCPLDGTSAYSCAPALYTAAKSTYCVSWSNCLTEYFPYAINLNNKMENVVKIGVDAGYPVDEISRLISYVSAVSIRCIKKI